MTSVRCFAIAVATLTAMAATAQTPIARRADCDGRVETSVTARAGSDRDGNLVRYLATVTRQDPDQFDIGIQLQYKPPAYAAAVKGATQELVLQAFDRKEVTVAVERRGAAVTPSIARDQMLKYLELRCARGASAPTLR